MKSCVIGLGETGNPLFGFLRQAYPETYGFDEKFQESIKPNKFDVMNVCIPYGEQFFNSVEQYRELFNPDFIVIHSTVPIGTTSRIPNAVHSPILGTHGRMEEDMMIFPKWIGGDESGSIYLYLSHAGFRCKVVKTSEESEALKLICLAKYGMSIAFAEYIKGICDTYDFPYDDVIEWDKSYNSGVRSFLKRPIITPPNGHIGGHCIIPNTRILNQQHPNQILDEILKYG